MGVYSSKVSKVSLRDHAFNVVQLNLLWIKLREALNNYYISHTEYQISHARAKNIIAKDF